MLNVVIPVVIYFVGLIFAAGGGWVALKEVRRQVNGVGGKLNASEKERNDRHNRLCMAIVAMASEEKKQLVVECLGGKE